MEDKDDPEHFLDETRKFLHHVQQEDRFVVEGIYKGVFLDKKNKNNNPRYISLKKIYKPQIKEILDYGLLNDTIFKITENN